MKTGTKSVLFGVHTIWWHPITVYLAWLELYGVPNFQESVCIFIHDIGYLNCSNMDGDEGESHPQLGANIAQKLFGNEYYKLCLYHSRTIAHRDNVQPSKLCWADKLSIKYDPWFFYLPRAILSGEIKEYYKDAVDHKLISNTFTLKEWFLWAQERGIRVAYTRNIAKAYNFV